MNTMHKRCARASQRVPAVDSVTRIERLAAAARGEGSAARAAARDFELFCAMKLYDSDGEDIGEDNVEGEEWWLAARLAQCERIWAQMDQQDAMLRALYAAFDSHPAFDPRHPAFVGFYGQDVRASPWFEDSSRCGKCPSQGLRRKTPEKGALTART
ncbi:hypothetical protein T492DRAFT_979209 [Pavlovales sp. CCMP2436]|nr:hypothetical protein T492DRAFT_979209 [Pavlovales sp. CCMP2436]|mmetsp:Transcript_16616/g.42423  ORF Transcript_16616/g.42423 Transcript_16616/m.42423 type:complete len:157 (-) Transcript_16616:79-549(-)